MTGDKLVDGDYQPIEVSANQSGIARGHSDTLNLDLCVRQNLDPKLRLYDPRNGEWLLSASESRQALHEAEARLEESQAEIQRLRELLAQSVQE